MKKVHTFKGQPGLSTTRSASETLLLIHDVWERRLEMSLDISVRAERGLRAYRVFTHLKDPLAVTLSP